MAHHDDFKGRIGRRRRARWPLLESGYQPQTVARYKRAVIKFLEWCATTKQDARNYDEFDELLADYLQNMYEEKRGKGKQLAKETLYGIYMYMPRATDKLYVSDRIVNRWCKGQPPVSYPPLTWELAVIIAVQMVRNGHDRYGVATLVASDCLLRIGEFTKLCAFTSGLLTVIVLLIDVLFRFPQSFWSQIVLRKQKSTDSIRDTS